VRHVPRCMAGSCDRRDAWEKLAARLVLRHSVPEMREHALSILEIDLRNTPGRHATQISVIRPELPFRFGNQNLGIGKGRLVVRREQAVDVITVQVRNDDSIDRISLDAGGRKIAVELADGAIARLKGGRSHSGIENDYLGAGVCDDGRERRRDLVSVHVEAAESVADLCFARVFHISFRQRLRDRAVRDGGDLDGADPVAIEAGGLLPGRPGRDVRKRMICHPGQGDRA
jgi:hypothetical protein